MCPATRKPPSFLTTPSNFDSNLEREGYTNASLQPNRRDAAAGSSGIFRPLSTHPTQLHGRRLLVFARHPCCPACQTHFIEFGSGSEYLTDLCYLHLPRKSTVHAMYNTLRTTCAHTTALSRMGLATKHTACKVPRPAYAPGEG